MDTDTIKVGCAPYRIVTFWPAANVPDPRGVFYPVVVEAPERCYDCEHFDHCAQFVDDYVAAHRMTTFVDIIYPLGDK